MTESPTDALAGIPATETIAVTGLTNAQFLAQYAAPGRVGLCGGSDAINRAIRKLQYGVTADGRRSPWSHAFICSGVRADDHHWVLESDLDLRHKQIRLGVQENRIDRYADENDFPNLAILDFGLSDAQTKAVLTSALDLLSGLSTYSLRELVGTLLATQHAPLRRRKNLLEVEGALYCSAMVQHCYQSVGIDFVPGVDRKNVTPHDIGGCPRARTAYLLVREAHPVEAPGIRARLKQLVDDAKG